MTNEEAITLLQEADKSFWSVAEDKALTHAIEVLRADTKLRAENDLLRKGLTNVHNFARHDLQRSIDKAIDEFMATASATFVLKQAREIQKGE